MPLLKINIAIILLLFLTVENTYAQDHDHQYGKVNFSISCNDEAQENFINGLGLLHHMMYEQAEAQFKSAGEADPECAMAHWGIAMSVIHPLWGERPTDEELKKGADAIARASEISSSMDREVEFIAAVKPFFEDWENTSYTDQLVAFEAGYQKLHDAYPDDIDAGAFYALGQLATAPKADKTYGQQRKAGALLEELHKRAPEHPGLFHYIIHAYDNPVLAERAVDVARAYDKIAPEVPHALHMPSHIFVRLGIWPDVISWNERSAAAALKQPVGNMTSMHYAHALDYLMYAHLQRGEDQKAKEVYHKMNAVNNLQPNLGAAYAIAAVQARYPLERGNWEDASRLALDSDPDFPLERYAAAKSILYYARGLGAARSGDVKGVDNALDKLIDIQDRLTQAGEQYWAVLTEAQRMTVEAWKAFSNDDHDKALALMKKAADKEDSVDKHPVTPGHVLPARELLGDMLLELNRSSEALEAYEASLTISANRFNSLYGAGRAAELSGDMEKAKQFYTALVEVSTKGDIDRPAFKAATKFLATN